MPINNSRVGMLAIVYSRIRDSVSCKDPKNMQHISRLFTANKALEITFEL